MVHIVFLFCVYFNVLPSNSVMSCLFKLAYVVLTFEITKLCFFINLWFPYFYWFNQWCFNQWWSRWEFASTTIILSYFESNSNLFCTLCINHLKEMLLIHIFFYLQFHNACSTRYSYVLVCFCMWTHVWATHIYHNTSLLFKP